MTTIASTAASLDLTTLDLGAAATPVPGLDHVADAWRPLDARASHPTQQYSWIRESAASFCQGAPITVVSAGLPGWETAIAAFHVPPGEGSTFCLPGARELGEPMDLTFAHVSALEELAAKLARLDRPILLERIPADSPTVQAMQRAFRWPGMVVRRRARPYPFVPLDASWLEPDSHVNAGRRSDLRRARRRAEQLGPVRFDLTPVTSAELRSRLDHALRVEAAGWKGEEGTAMLADAAGGRFFTSYAAEACRQGTLRLNLMYVGDSGGRHADGGRGGRAPLVAEDRLRRVVCPLLAR